MELRQYGLLLWRWAWLILLAAVLAGGAAYAASQAQTPVYRASTSILIDQAPDARNSEFASLLLAERLTDTYAELLVKRPVLEEVIRKLEIDLGVNAFAGSIEVTPVRETQIIDVAVENESPVTAATLANMLVVVFSEQNANMQSNRFAASKDSLELQLTKLEEQIQLTEEEIASLGAPFGAAEEANLERLQGELARYQNSHTMLLQSYEALRLQEALSVSNIVQVEEAEPPTSPIRPRTTTNVMLATVVGAMLAVGVVFLIEYLDDSVKGAAETSAALRLPLIGFITSMKGKNTTQPFVSQNPRSPITEAFRSLRTNIHFADVDRPIRTLLITSPGPEEGKTTVAANLAIVMAQDGRKILLLDADMRKPRLHRIMGMPNRSGLTNIFTQKEPNLSGAVQRWEQDGVFLLTSGKLPPNPAELLGSERMMSLIDALHHSYDMVIIDSPPAGVVTDPTILAARVDATLLIVEPKRTKLRAAMQAVEQLQRANANLVGLVFNNVPLRHAGYYSGYEKGYYYYQYAEYYEGGGNGKRPGLLGKRGRSKKKES